MIWIEATCNLYGPEFSPRLAEVLTGLSFSEKCEPGQLGKCGRFKGKSIPFGSSILTPPHQATVANPDFGIEWLADVVSIQRQNLEKAFVTDVTIRLNVFHDGQCNMEMSQELLRRLADSGVKLTVSCFEDSDYVKQMVSRASRDE
jgi:hypothetical protein